MAVIDTSMDMPKSCEVCPNYQGENTYCLKGCFIPYRMFDIGDVIHVECPLKEVSSGKKQAILDELAKESDMLISTAYLYAKAFVSYGVDVTQAWTTAVQQTANLEQAHKRGYYEALKMVEEQQGEKKYCDRNLCLKNEYNGIGCEDCDVMKQQGD